MDPASILEHFALLPDPRREHGQVHRLDEVVFMAICGVLCGADSWQEIADYSESKLDWLSTFLSLPGGIPSHDTFRRVFCLLDPVAFQACFYDWMTSLMARYGVTPAPPGRPGLRPVAIDGKTQRGSARRTVGRSPLHMVSAWAVENHLSLGQVATDAKSNEITANPIGADPRDAGPPPGRDPVLRPQHHSFGHLPGRPPGRGGPSPPPDRVRDPSVPAAPGQPRRRAHLGPAIVGQRRATRPQGDLLRPP